MSSKTKEKKSSSQNINFHHCLLSFRNNLDCPNYSKSKFISGNDSKCGK